jgi:hypothetical protein
MSAIPSLSRAILIVALHRKSNRRLALVKARPDLLHSTKRPPSARPGMECQEDCEHVHQHYPSRHPHLYSLREDFFVPSFWRAAHAGSLAALRAGCEEIHPRRPPGLRRAHAALRQGIAGGTRPLRGVDGRAGTARHRRSGAATPSRPRRWKKQGYPATSSARAKWQALRLRTTRDDSSVG